MRLTFSRNSRAFIFANFANTRISGNFAGIKFRVFRGSIPFSGFREINFRGFRENDFSQILGEPIFADFAVENIKNQLYFICTHFRDQPDFFHKQSACSFSTKIGYHPPPPPCASNIFSTTSMCCLLTVKRETNRRMDENGWIYNT